MSKCKQLELDLFDLEHKTYINQIFGDETIREIITETYAPRDWYFVVEAGVGVFEGTDHHVLERKLKNGEIERWCSVDEGIQNNIVNVNDNLCQSYSLLKFLNKPLTKNMKKTQKEMINMYRAILKRPYFKKELQNIVTIMNAKIDKLVKGTKKSSKKKKEDKTLWFDYTSIDEPYLYKDYHTIYAEILNVLDKWEKYGYWLFVKEGNCPK